MNSLFFPIIAAVLYGLNYAILGKILQSISIATFVFYSTVLGLFLAAFIVSINKSTLDIFVPITSPVLMGWMILAVCASWTGWIFTTIVMKDVSPTYAAIGEIAYPVFVPIFAYLLFKEKQWDTATLIGGGLIFFGLFVMIFFKSRG